jgi:tetratricopeptide (TPR) repeat protein
VALLAGRLQTYFGLWNNRMGQLHQAQAAYESAWSILEDAGDPGAAALCLGAWGTLLRGSDPPRAAVLLREALRLVQDGKPSWMHAIGNEMLGEVSFLLGDYAAAAAQLTNALALATQLGWFSGMTSTQKTLGLAQLTLGDYRAAAAHLAASIDLARTHHFTMLCVESLLFLGRTHRLQGQLSEAAACFAESRALAVTLGGGRFLAPVLWEEGGLAEQQGEYAAAVALLQESLAIGLPLWWSHALPTLGWALLGQGALDEAAAQFEQVLAAADAQGRRPTSLDAQAGLAYAGALQARRYAHNGQVQAAIETCAARLRAIYADPAAAAETRKRIKKITAHLFPTHVGM